jgi:hypothetical protein
MTYIPGGRIGVAEIKASTSGVTPVNVWPDGLASAWPPGSTYRALVSAVETTLLANVNYRHFLLLGTYMITSESSKIFTNTEVDAAGTGGSVAWTAAFINDNDSPAIRLVGSGSLDISWRIFFELVKTRS